MGAVAFSNNFVQLNYHVGSSEKQGTFSRFPLKKMENLPHQFPDLQLITGRVIKFAKAIGAHIAEATETALKINTAILDQGKAVNALVVRSFKAALMIERLMIPFRFFGWLNGPLISMSLMQNTLDFIKTPGWGRVVPALRVGVDMGDLAEHTINIAELMEEVGVAAFENASLWTTPLTGLAVGLQALSLIINGWGLWEASYTLNKLKEHLGERGESLGPTTPQQYQAALNFLTKEPKSRMQKFRAKFFKVISDWQENKVRKIFKKYVRGALSTPKIGKTLSVIKHRFHLKQLGYGIAIAATVTGATGILILTFAPTPAAPIGWVLVGAGATAILIGLGTSVYGSRRLNRELLMIAPKRYDKLPWYRRPIVWIKKLIRRKKGERFELIQSENF